MTVVRPADAERYILTPPKNVFLFVLHGENGGLISLRARGLVEALAGSQRDRAEVLKIDGDAIAADSGAFLDDAYSISMFQEIRIARISAGRKSFISALQSLLERPPSQFSIIVDSGPLRRDAPLRALAEASAGAAAIECAPDGANELHGIIEAQAKTAGVCVGAEARSLLASLLPSDRLANRGELEKLFLFSGGDRTISSEDVRNIVENSSELAAQDMVDSALLGDRKSFGELAVRLSSLTVEANAVSAGLLWHAMQLHRARAAVEGGRGGSAASEAARLGVFFKRRERFEKQLRKFDLPTLMSFITRLDANSAQGRKAPRLAAAGLERVLGEFMSAI